MFDDPMTCSCDRKFPSSLKNVWYLGKKEIFALVIIQLMMVNMCLRK